MDEPLHMWSYWSKKYGVIRALEDYYHNILDSDKIIQYAHTQYKAYYVYVISSSLLDLEEQMTEAAEEIINNRMKELVDALPDEEDD